MKTATIKGLISELVNILKRVQQKKNGKSETAMWKVGHVQYDNVEFHDLITEMLEEQYQIKCIVPNQMKGIFNFESDEYVIGIKKKNIIQTAAGPILLKSQEFYKF